MENETVPKPKRYLLALWVSKDDHTLIKTEAASCGYDISTLLRLRIFGTFKKIKIISRPSPEIMLLSTVAGKLKALETEGHKISANIERIAHNLDQGKRDLFALDGSLHLLEKHCEKVAGVLEGLETYRLDQRRWEGDV